MIKVMELFQLENYFLVERLNRYRRGINPKGPSEKDLPDGTHVDAFTKEEILDCYEDYVTACKWFQAAGWEGIMIHCGHGWLPAQFYLQCIINEQMNMVDLLKIEQDSR